MASHFRIQKPYELTSLPKTLDQTVNTYAVGEVFGQAQGSKKRKRPELAVGINGEALNIYDAPSSRLITSYPVPPQASFSCPPLSLRYKTSDKNITRYTYASTLEPRPKLSLYKDALGAAGGSASTSVSHPLPRSCRIVHLASTSAAKSVPSHPDLIAVAKTGAVSCFDGESLEERWSATPAALKQDTGLTASAELRIDLAQLASVADVVRGLFGGKDDLVKLFLPNTAEDVENADLLVLLSTASVADKEVRHVHVAAIPPPTHGSTGGSQGVIQIFAAPLPARASSSEEPPIYRFDLASGSVTELCAETVTTYDISSAVPRAESELHIPGARSFLRISKTSILTATETDLAIYNPLYRSLQASLPVEAAPKQAGTYKLVAYFARLEMVVALFGASLVAIQLEAPKSRSKKRRAEGLLIDSIGRGLVAPVKISKPSEKFEATGFSTFTPPPLESVYGLGSWMDDAKQAEDSMESGEYDDFEKFMAFSFEVHCVDDAEHGGAEGVAMDIDEPKANGVASGPRRVTGPNGDSYWAVNGRALPIWSFPDQLKQADRRMVMYSIQRAFTVVNDGVSNLLGWRLRCRLPWSGVLQYQALAGHLTIPNVQAALESEHPDLEGSENVLAEQLPLILAEVDPTLGLLLTWLAATGLGPVDILSSVKIIMRSLELIQDPQKMTKNLLTDAPANDAENSAQEGGEIGMELDRLEEQLNLTEHYLVDESSNRARGLSIAFNKLGGCPPSANVRAIQQIFRPEETLSLIYLLRMELNRAGWTSRYLDGTRLVENDEVEAVPDSSIRSIADLLCQCIDSVGPGGWLINDMLALVGSGSGDHVDAADFLGSMKLEVSVALEGVEEAVYLRGILTEVVRYGASLPKSGSSKDLAAVPPTSLSSALPLGSKTSKHQVSKRKVVSGGEIKERTAREVGLLTSRKVADYSFERIVI
ncbi:hypothetical protein GGTG_08093 [Gaeumannomyces tritici R3-111a-1]|uniref:Utp8 beta-propeller domain-containing protein n=1 Tax=Gaeumannomyces tritici (strain R3-111a-1) TaxID=644352 RepID=J3P3K7_GAET3|nr:hypothetical protein GGTG_08093 [Gaeumannomyces tritici R3-111a-1]EJT74250.1 hypothetical protein GGTG_08093 [Gaeumannomyces tritici R3-111a-1]